MKVLKQRVRSVALIGMDGSGKSTQARLLCQVLRGQTRHVILMHPFGWKLLSFIVRRVGPGPSQAACQRPGWISTFVACLEIGDIGLYLWIMTLRCYLTAYFTQETVWLVSDRSIDDLLIKHYRRHNLPATLLMAIRSLMPKAQTTVWLNTAPETAKGRDGEHSDRYYLELNQLYQRAASRFNWKVIASSDQPQEAILCEIARAIGLPVPSVVKDQAIGLVSTLERTSR